MKILTKAEEQIMHVLWGLDKCSVKDVIDVLPEPKPAYNTVSTIIRILENKEFVGHEQKGRGYLYFPLVTKELYKTYTSVKLANNFFEGSFKNMVSFFVENEKLNLKDLEEILKNIKE